MPDTAKVVVKNNLLNAVSEPATLRTVIICACILASVVCGLAAVTDGNITVGGDVELIDELRLTREGISGLTDAMHELKLDIVSISHRVDRLERLQDEENEGSPRD